MADMHERPPTHDLRVMNLWHMEPLAKGAIATDRAIIALQERGAALMKERVIALLTAQLCGGQDRAVGAIIDDVKAMETRL